jgi:PleD family two-component response regulator
MTVRVLVAESQPEDTLFLRDVLAELDGGRHWSAWTRVEALLAGSWEEARVLLAHEPVDVMLLDLDLCDCQGAETFRRSQKAAPQVPVVLLVDPTSVPLAERLLREGAQDFLLKQQVDCAPLARTLAGAMARHRVLAAARATSMVDPLTGLLSRTAFLLLAERDRMLAERLERRLLVIVAEIKDLDALAAAWGDHRRDLELVETADYLRSLAGPTDLTARLNDSTLAISIFETERETVEEAWARLHAATAQRRVTLGAAVFDPLHPLPLERLIDQAFRDLTPRAAQAGR